MIKMSSNLPEFAAKLRLAAQIVRSRRQSIHKAFGVYLLSRARRDFQAMSRGGTSSFGEKWAPIKKETLRARITKLKSAKDKAAAVAKSRKAIKAGRIKLRKAHKLLLESTRNSAKYKAAANHIRKARTKINAHKRIIAGVKAKARGRVRGRSGLSGRGGRPGTRPGKSRLNAKATVARNRASIKRLGKKVAAAKLQRSQMRAAPKSHAATLKKLHGRLDRARKAHADYMHKMTSSHQIGVDTGRLRDSSQPGYDGGDSKGGNLFEATEQSVKVGYGRTYAKFFDEKRKLLPAQDNVPQEWIAGLEKIAHRQTLRAMGEAFRGDPGTVTQVG